MTPKKIGILTALQMFVINEVPLFFSLARGYYFATRRANNGIFFSVRNGISLAAKAMDDRYRWTKK
jgi:hypothetical protein